MFLYFLLLSQMTEIGNGKFLSETPKLIGVPIRKGDSLSVNLSIAGLIGMLLVNKVAFRIGSELVFSLKDGPLTIRWSCLRHTCKVLRPRVPQRSEVQFGCLFIALRTGSFSSPCAWGGGPFWPGIVNFLKACLVILVSVTGVVLDLEKGKVHVAHSTGSPQGPGLVLQKSLLNIFLCVFACVSREKFNLLILCFERGLNLGEFPGSVAYWLVVAVETRRRPTGLCRGPVPTRCPRCWPSATSPMGCSPPPRCLSAPLTCPCPTWGCTSDCQELPRLNQERQNYPL